MGCWCCGCCGCPPEDEIEGLADGVRGHHRRRAGCASTEPSAAEIADDDELTCKRLAVDFNQTRVGRLRRLIDELNRF